ncbi:MAG: response regulator [Vampirovibrionales bacterium]
MSLDLKFLVVDDSAVMRKVIISALENKMDVLLSNVLQAVDGVEAVEKAAQNNDLTAILMDWNMPNKLGIDALREIRAAGNKTPIIMVTTEGEKTNVVTAIQSGANNYVVKPFNADDLCNKIRQSCGLVPTVG